MRLSAKGMAKLNEISTKYKFRDDFELEQDEVYDFCDALMRCVRLGLNIEQEDGEFLEQVIEALTKYSGDN